MSKFNLTQLNHWVNQTSLRALEEAHQGAQVIKNIEDTHFNGGLIMAQPGKAGIVTDYFRTQLDRQLLRVRSNLLRFRATHFLVNRQVLNESLSPTSHDSATEQDPMAMEATVLEKLAFIEAVVGKYRVFNDLFADPTPITPEPTLAPEVLKPDSQDVTAEARKQLYSDANRNNPNRNFIRKWNIRPTRAKVKPLHNQVPPSPQIFGGVSQIGKEFNPKYEQEVVQELRIRRTQNRAAVRWLSVLLIIPILVQVSVKQFILNPVLGDYSTRNPIKIELSQAIEEKFLQEFSNYKETLEIKALLVKALMEEEQISEQQERSGAVTALAKAIYGENSVMVMQDTLSSQLGDFQGLVTAAETSAAVETALEQKALQEKAIELWREARDEQLNGLKNVLADGTGLLTFVGLVYFGRQKLAAVRSFSNRAFLSLNDPSKVFLFILVTDTFVGFHSAEGWDVLLEGILNHFGLPESKVFINSFIATVPVILDSCIKFWIFNYLTRYSPSTSAIYERMNT
ncbi:MAG: hypothetical protein HC827_23510 [Cyanobacteria bacterium RM1_2_2]|nr:hypothetical protein [Cyanobacteria bacterium RM1_2_2]